MIIYKSTNLINGKCYVGKTTDTLEIRRGHHISTAYKNRNNMMFHRAIRKYGKENFKWEVLFECNDILILNVMETFKIMVCHSHKSEGKGYNMTWGGEGIYGHKHTDETKKKMSKVQKSLMTDERKKEISEKLKGHPVSQETKTKIREKRKYQVMTEETKKKISDANKGKCRRGVGWKHTKEAKRKIGAASRKYNDEILLEIKKMLEDGITRHSIADKMCIPYPTINEWIRKYISK